MEKKHTIFSYLTQVFMIYGISTVLLNIFTLVFGKDAQKLSSIFALGDSGVSVQVSLQFLLAMFIVVGIEYLFTSDFMTKRLPMCLRTVLIMALAVGVIIGFILGFGWFPAGEPLPWILFGVCFLISFGLSVLISGAYERSENKKMAEALKKFKEEQ